MIDSPRAVTFAAGSEWVKAIRFANQLLRGGWRLLVVSGSLAEEPRRESLRPGDFIVPLSPAIDPGLESAPDFGQLRDIASESGVELAAWDTRDGLLAAPLRAVVVGLYGGGGAPFNQAAILAACGFRLRFLSDADIRAGALDEVDALVVPGGGFRAMHGQIEPLGEAGCRAIAAWVRRGGMYVGSCAGSYACALTPESFVASCPAQRHLQLINARVWNDAPRDFGSLQSPGIGVVSVRNARPDHPVMFGLPETFEIAHYNGPIFDVDVPAEVDGASAAVGLAAFSGWTERFTPAEAFMGAAADDDMLLRRAIAAGRFSAVAGYLGAGRVVAFGSHPEFGFDLPMIEWSLPARMLANAVLWQATCAPPSGRRAAAHVSPWGTITLPLESALAVVARHAEQVIARAQTLQAKPVAPPPQWLTPDYAMSFFGESSQQIWRQSLAGIVTMSAEITRCAEALRQKVSEATDVHGGGAHDPDLRAAIQQMARWLLAERPAEWQQDGGYQGVLALLRTATRMCDSALEQWDMPLGPPDGAYGYIHENPYHLVAGSYLAAIGCVGGALSLLHALSDELDTAERLAQHRGYREATVLTSTMA